MFAGFVPGPGKLTQALDITKRHHEMSICADARHCLLPRPQTGVEVVADARIGISRSKDFPWRFTLAGSPFVSRAGSPASDMTLQSDDVTCSRP